MFDFFFHTIIFFFNALFIITNSSWLIFESIKALEINTSMLFNLMLLLMRLFYHVSFFFLVIDLYFIIPAAIAQI